MGTNPEFGATDHARSLAGFGVLRLTWYTASARKVKLGWAAEILRSHGRFDLTVTTGPVVSGFSPTDPAVRVESNCARSGGRMEVDSVLRSSLRICATEAVAVATREQLGAAAGEVASQNV